MPYIVKIAILSRGRYDSTNFHEFVNQSTGYSYFFINIGILACRNPETFTAVEFKDPKPAPLDLGRFFPGKEVPQKVFCRIGQAWGII